MLNHSWRQYTNKAWLKIVILLMSLFRNSRPEVFCKKGVLRNSAKVTGKHLCQSLFFKKETLTQVFSCEFCKISKNTFFHRTPLEAASEYYFWLIQRKLLKQVSTGMAIWDHPSVHLFSNFKYGLINLPFTTHLYRLIIFSSSIWIFIKTKFR